MEGGLMHVRHKHKKNVAHPTRIAIKTTITTTKRERFHLIS